LDFYCVVVENKTIPKRSFYWYPPWPPLARIFKKSVTRALLPQFTECDLDQQLRIGSKSLQNKHQSSSERFHLCNCRANSPFATIRRGVGEAAALAGDDIVEIQPGVYAESVIVE
jgi:hypothetical protein